MAARKRAAKKQEPVDASLRRGDILWKNKEVLEVVESLPEPVQTVPRVYGRHDIDRPMPLTAGEKPRRSHIWNSYYSPTSGDWLEPPCSDGDCELCPKRPERMPV